LFVLLDHLAIILQHVQDVQVLIVDHFFVISVFQAGFSHFVVFSDDDLSCLVEATNLFINVDLLLWQFILESRGVSAPAVHGQNSKHVPQVSHDEESDED